MIIVGITLNFTFENEGIDFLTGLLIGGGAGLLISSRFSSKATQ